MHLARPASEQQSIHQTTTGTGQRNSMHNSWPWTFQEPPRTPNSPCTAPPCLLLVLLDCAKRAPPPNTCVPHAPCECAVGVLLGRGVEPPHLLQVLHGTDQRREPVAQQAGGAAHVAGGGAVLGDDAAGVAAESSTRGEDVSSHTGRGMGGKERKGGGTSCRASGHSAFKRERSWPAGRQGQV